MARLERFGNRIAKEIVKDHNEWASQFEDAPVITDVYVKKLNAYPEVTLRFEFIFHLESRGYSYDPKPMYEVQESIRKKCKRLYVSSIAGDTRSYSMGGSSVTLTASVTFHKEVYYQISPKGYLYGKGSK